MKLVTLVSKNLLICCLFFILFGCDTSPKLGSQSQSHQEACKVILNYANQYEQTYLQYEGDDMYNRLSRVEDEYRRGISELDKSGKWTPMNEMGTSIKLSFLVGQFHGAVQSCKLERASNDKTLVGCHQADELQNKMVDLLSR